MYIQLYIHTYTYIIYIYILESSGRPLGGLDSSTILDHVQTFQIVNIGQPTHAPLVSEKRLKNSLRTFASHTELQIYIYKEIILTVAGSGRLVLRWEGWVTRTKVTGCSTVQGKVLHSNGVSCFTPRSYYDIQTLISVGCNQPHPYTST